MRNFIRSPIAALIWEIWLKNRKWIWAVIAMNLFCWLVNAVWPDHFALTSTLSFTSWIFVFGIFNDTETRPEKVSIGFPTRFFTLPVSSLKLVAVPMALGVVSIEAVYLASVALVFRHSTDSNPLWTAMLMGVFMVLYQTTLWTLARYGSVRTIALGVISIIFLVIGFAPSFPRLSLTASAFERVWTARLLALAVISFLATWAYVARQRSGGGRTRRNAKVLLNRTPDAAPAPEAKFGSPMAAHFWFEWRGSGVILPRIIGMTLLLVIAPLSWTLRGEPGGTLRMLIAIAAMPIALALPVGKAFSKPSFWSAELSLPAFLSVLPLTNSQMVAIRMAVAAASTAVSWLLVLVFIAVWLPLWGNVESLRFIRAGFSRLYGPSVYSESVIVALAVVAGIVLTWRFLVDSLWIGLSGSRALFTVSALPYGLLGPVGLIAFIKLLHGDDAAPSWIQRNLDRLVPDLLWFGIVVAILKFGVSACCWRTLGGKGFRQYLPLWAGCTFCLMALAGMLWSGLRDALPPTLHSVGNLLLVIALSTVPLGRLGLAPLSLARNRHR
jgi:hypothetical protein